MNGCLATMAALLLAACGEANAPDSPVASGTVQDPALTLCTSSARVNTRAVTTEALQDDGTFDDGVQVDVFFEDATDAGDGSTSDSWTSYEKPLTYVSDGTGTLTTYEFVNDGTEYAPDWRQQERVLFWPKLLHGLNVYGVYPSGIADGSAITRTGGVYPKYPFTVSANQSAPGDALGINDEMRGYKGSDLMIGIPATLDNNAVPGNAVTQTTTMTGRVGLAFRHMLSKVIVNIQVPDGGMYTEAQLSEATVKLLQLKPSTTFCVKDQTITAASGTATDIIARRLETSVTYDDEGQPIVTPLYGGVSVAAVIVPQTVAAATDFISITVGTDVFVYQLADATTFAGSMVYTYDITLGEADFVLTATVGDWTPGEALPAGELNF